MSQNKNSFRGYKRSRYDWTNEEECEPLFTEILFDASDKYDECYAAIFGAYHGSCNLGHLALVTYHVGHSGRASKSTFKSIARQLQKQNRATRSQLAELRTLGLDVAHAYWAYMCVQ